VACARRILAGDVQRGTSQIRGLVGGAAVVLWIAFVMIFQETLGWTRFAPPGRGPDRDDRFQLSGAEWTAEEDALLLSLIGSGKLPRSIALEMKRPVGAFARVPPKLGLRNNRLGDTFTG
jgi:hypothetical protein